MCDESGPYQPRPWYTKKIISIPLIFVSLAFVGGLSGCGKSATSLNSAAPAVASNPLDTADNKTACHTGRFTYAQNSQAIADWSNGAATDADLEISLKKIGDFFYDVGTTASGELQTTMEQIGTLYKQARVAAVNGDSTSLVSDLTAALPLATQFDNECKSIGEN